RAPGLASQVLDGVRVPLDAPLRIELGAPSSVRGRVLDGDGKPIEGALVVCEALAPSPALPMRPEELPAALWGGARSGADGAFELVDVPLGMRRVIALASGYAARSSASFELRAGEPLRIGDIVLGRGGAIAGRVERGDGAPWPNVRVLASSMNFDGAPLLFDMCDADADGRYRIEHLPAGPYVAMHFGDARRRASAPEALLPARVRDGETTVLDFVDPRAKLTLTGRVTQPDGKPAANYSLTLGLARDQGETWKGATTDADGVYAFRGLDAGTWELHGGRNMALSMTRIAVVELAGRGEVVRDVALASGALRGRVVAARDGKPIAKAILLVMSEDSSGDASDFRGKCAADSDGRYELAPLPGGRYRVWAIDEHGACATTRTDWLALAEGQSLELADLALEPAGSAELVVRERDGATVEGAALVFAPFGAGEVPIALGPRTDAFGAFTARGLAPGAWTVRATHADGRVAEIDFRVEPARATRVELEFRAR
ncbi:MAG: carboxypeptidase regulatory-like domain-containing protein, partial [Planctomycetota bacterium]